LFNTFVSRTSFNSDVCKCYDRLSLSQNVYESFVGGVSNERGQTAGAPSVRRVANGGYRTVRCGERFAHAQRIRREIMVNTDNELGRDSVLFICTRVWLRLRYLRRPMIPPSTTRAGSTFRWVRARKNIRFYVFCRSAVKSLARSNRRPSNRVPAARANIVSFARFPSSNRPRRTDSGPEIRGPDVVVRFSCRRRFRPTVRGPEWCAQRDRTMNSSRPSYYHSHSSFSNNSLAICKEIQRFESVHPSIYAIYDLIELIPDPIVAQQVRDHVVCIEGKYFCCHST